MKIGAIRRPRASTLRHRLIISSLLGAIPLIVLGLALILSNYLTSRRETLRSNLRLAELNSAYIEGWLEGQVRTLRTLAGSAEVRRYTPPELQGLVDRQLAVQTEWDNLFVTNASGKIIAGRYRPFIDVGDREFFRQAQRMRKPIVSNPISGRISGHLIVVVAVPILRQSRFIGVVAASIRPMAIQKVFNHIPTESQVTLALWGNDRQLIVHSRSVPGVPGERYTGTVLEHLLVNRSGTLVGQDPVTGRQTLMAHVPVEGSPWIMVTSTPLHVALGPAYRVTAYFLLAAALVLIGSLAWSFFSAGVIARQVRVLADSAHAIGEGNLDTRIDMRGGGELADLAASLNKMAADLQVIDRFKSDLLSLVSHELKTPLTSIRTSLDLIVAGVVMSDTPQYHELLQIADRQARRLQDMIENLLNIARSSSGGLRLTMKPESLNAIVNASVRLFADIARERNLSLTVEMPDQVSVLTDAAKITLVLNNLLDNAVKFTEQGSITIRVTTRGREAVVSVIDTGIGLASDVRPRLFERFYQAEPLLTRKTTGAGLGLAVVKAIVEAHGGMVFADSAGPGQGSTFGFTLPLVPEV